VSLEVNSHLEEFTLKYLRETGPTTGTKLFGIIKVTFPSLTEVEFADLISRLADSGQAELYDETERIDSFLEYLTLERTGWYHVSVTISLLTLVIVYLVPSDSPLVFLRWAFGLLFVLFIPGYVMVEALLPSTGSLRGLERYAVSVGASLVLDMLVGLLLNYTPWGIGLIPILVSLAAFSVCAASVALVRKFVAIRTDRASSPGSI